MNPDDEPALKRSAGAASDAAQRVFLRLSTLQLGLLATTAVIAGWRPLASSGQRAGAVAVCGLMFVAFLISIALKLGHFDDKWFRCRALAENVKRAMWYFVMSPANERTAREADYRQQIEDIQDRFPLAKDLAAHRVEGPLVTEWMNWVHGMPLDGKLQQFKLHRIQDQTTWYQTNASSNAKRESRWQWLVFVIEAAAILLAGMQVWGLWLFNAVGGLAAIGAACVAWSQTKRHSDLANSYAVAAEDLRRIAERWGSPRSDDELRQLVDYVERAVSREHSVWLSRRVA